MDLQVEHRPKTLKDFVGQEAIVKSICEDYKNKTLQHTMIFTGESGVGKTTLAYLIARQLLKCHEHYIIEKNAADTRGIDDARQITGNLANRPLIGKNKVYIIDEAHQLTNEAQNALLKPLEDPRNKHVYWIFCTTNPAKIIKTIKTRGAQYNFSKLSAQEIGKVLLPIVEKEKIDLPDQVLKMIVKRADGIPREAVKLLGQLRHLKDKDDILRVLQEFETEGDEFKNLVAFLRRPWAEIGPKLKKLYEKKQADSIRIGLLCYYRVVLENAKNIKDAELAYNMIEILKNPIETRPAEPVMSWMFYKVHLLLKGDING